MDHKNIIFNENNNSEILIDIYSPFFNILSKTDFFDEIFIRIYANIIQKYNLFNDYIDKFNELNKSNSNYSIIFNCSNNDDIDFFKKFSINFDKIKRLTIQFNKEIKEANYFYKALFSYNLDNLIYLRLCNNYVLIDSNSIENLNNLKALEELHLQNLKFENVFMLKLYNLKKLSLYNCTNIAFPEDKYLNLKQLIIENCSIIKPKFPIIFPELEECGLEDISYINQNYNPIIDFKHLKKLKKLNSPVINFINLESNILADVSLTLGGDRSLENEKKMLIKILSIKSLKNVKFEIIKITDDELCKIYDVNESITKIEVYLGNPKINIYYLLQKFPNVSNLIINIPHFRNIKQKIEIKENIDSKINKFSISGGVSENIQFYCHSFESLEEAEFIIISHIYHLKNAFPIFNSKCQIIFKCLKKFIFENYPEDGNGIKLKILNNIYNNLDYMPNLKIFTLKCICADIKEDFYIKFIQKLLTFEFDRIDLEIKKNRKESNEEYSEQELKEIYNNIYCPNLGNIHIKKYK